MKRGGLINVGQLVREKYAKDGVFIVGFSSYQGTVIAGTSWDAPMEEMIVPPAIPGSVEERLHRENPQDRIILFGGDKPPTYAGHRAIGVVYNPANERGNYVPTALESRYDALLYIDNTTALHPLHITADGSRIPETYPFGL
jgi:erythromycin esterase-like protein